MTAIAIQPTGSQHAWGQLQRVAAVACGILLVQAALAAESSRTSAVLKYGDGKADGRKSYAGSGHMIRFSLPEGVDKVRGIRSHGSRYGLPQAPDED